MSGKHLSLLLLVGIALIVQLASLSAQGPPPAPTTPVDPDPRISYRYGQNMRFGVSVLKDAAGKPVSKRLTYSEDGSTNTTVTRIDGKEMEFGGADGKWSENNVKIPADDARQTRDGSKSTWVSGSIRITQIIEIVADSQPVEVSPGVQKRLYDTCLVRYIIENTDTKAHTAGLHFQLDTLIGDNDGVPFAVPGVTGLVTTLRDFPTSKDVPDYAQALEFPDLTKPGTVSHLTFKVGGGLEAPSRVSLIHWPGGNLSWDLPIVNMDRDSAIAMYWAEREIGPGEQRTIGFAYGLASVTSKEGKLGLTVNGTFEVGQTFTVAAYVHNPAKGEKLTLKLPDGLERAASVQETQDVPPAAGNDANSVVTWSVKALRVGQYPVSVRSTSGAEASKTVTIGAAAPPVVPATTATNEVSGRLTLLLAQQSGQVYGPSGGELDTEIVFRLDSNHEQLIGIRLGNGANNPQLAAHQAMYDLLREAYVSNRRVHVSLEPIPGRTSAHATRVWVETAK